ncbi:unnamed protein product [Meloidogyne enterolobii]|uniref:Uncharacterized protein n=1 Tax=Meloidogyne enterolobii TaxID=390850 RepID=A0ACB0ZXT4_MELEN
MLFNCYFLTIIFQLTIFYIFILMKSAYELDTKKSELLAHLFISRNLTLKFELLQKNGTEANLFSISERDSNKSFRISTSTIKKTVKFNFKSVRISLWCKSLMLRKSYTKMRELLAHLCGGCERGSDTGM